VNYRLLILFGVVLAGVALWLTLLSGPSGPVTTQANRPAGPDQGYSALDASVVETGVDGLPLYTLQAHQVQQDPGSDVINLRTVHMTYRDTSGGLWQGRSDQATAQQDSALIDLAGAVDISGTFAGSVQPAHILTDRLHVDTHKEIIQTCAAATLIWAGNVTDARCLVVDIKDHNLKLETDVHGHFVIP
jgi:LPS export ABC transporter protein LptC